MHASWERYHKNEFFTEEVFIRSANNCHKILDMVKDTNFDADVKLPKLYDDEQVIFQEKIKFLQRNIVNYLMKKRKSINHQKLNR